MSLDRQAVAQIALDSFAGAARFPQAAVRYLALGVDRYHVDLVRWEHTSYARVGATLREPLPGAVLEPVAAEFSESGVRAALQAIQAGEIAYPEFLRRILRAGVTDYSAYLSGRCVIYRGRRGEFHVENFPPART